MPEAPAKKIKIACSKCGQHLDVTELEPFSKAQCPSCQTVLVVPMIIGNYQLLTALGSGGMGTVYKAFDSTLQRYVAVKLMKKDLAANPQFVEDFTREARAAAALNHPNIAQILSFGKIAKQYYLVMELLEGGSLDHKIETRKRVSELETLEIGIQVASALRAAHQRGVIHRDIKPGNILFNAEGHAKVVDFGLARFAGEEKEKKGEEDGIWGTPYYIAPEKVAGEPEDFRSDIYSLGGSMFHALAGRAPFEADTATEVVLKHLKTPALSLKTFAPDICDDTAQAIGRMLRKTREERHESYDELIEELQMAKQAAIVHAEQRAGEKQKLKARQAGVIAAKEGAPPVTLKAVIGTVLVLAGCIATAWGIWHYRHLIWGSHDEADRTASSAAQPAGKAAVDTWPAAFDAWVDADSKLADGKYAAAVTSYRRAREAVPEDKKTKRPVLDCQIGLALNLQDKAAEAKKAFKAAAAAAEKPGLPEQIFQSNYAPVLGQLLAGDLKLPAVQPKLAKQLPWAWTLAQFYLGVQAMTDGKFKDAGKWMDGYVAAKEDKDAKWVTLFQPDATRLAADLKVINDAMADISKLRLAGNEDQAGDIIKGLGEQIKTPILLARVKSIEEDLKKAAAAQTEEKKVDPAVKQREQFAAGKKAIEAAATAATAALAEYSFDAAAKAFDDAAGKIETPELKPIAADRAGIYRRMVEMKKLIIANMAKTPYARPGLTNRSGAALAGSATKADDNGVTFATPGGEAAQKWADLSPLTMLTLMTYYSEITNAQNPAARAANFVALAWLSRDLQQTQYTAAYAANAAKIAPDAKAEWDKLSAPLPEPPGDKPAAPAGDTQAVLETKRVPGKTNAPPVSTDVEFTPVKKKPAK
ncbi:MAG: serine/threonine protein kinase [Verrucomicrobia bacterium]|nr:serine/threonine protein kinase [Verrucomicrobiota bacterium]